MPRHPPLRLPRHLLALLLLLPLASASDRCPVVLPSPPPSSRIVGGDLAPDLSASFAASLIEAFASVCTGSLLSARWVLTARHCLPSNATFVFLGGIDRASGTLIPVRAAHLYPSVPTLDDRDDIALVELAAPAPPNATFVRLNTNPDHPRPGAFLRSIGYGTLTFAGPNNRFLRQVDFPSVSTDVCAKEYDEPGVLDDRTLCAGYERGRCGICSGDSGGPLVQFDKEGRPVQMGIASRSRGCAWAGVPAIFTRVSTFVDWMDSIGAVYEPAVDAQQVMLQEEETPPVAQGVQTRVEERRGLPSYAIWILAGGPMLAFVVVTAIVLTSGKCWRKREGDTGGSEDSESERRNEEENRSEQSDGGGQGGGEVEIGEGV